MNPDLQFILTAIFAMAMPLTAWAVIVWMEKRDARRQREQDSARKADLV